MRPPSTDRKVVVLTGASSGIGRGTARALAARGDDVVLIARGATALAEVAAELSALPGRVLVVPADVADEEAVRGAARRAVDEFGRIDAWVNAASVWSYGRFEDTPADVFQRIVETNLFGAVHCARAVLPVFRTQGTGVLVNVASIYGHMSTPYAGPYVASKWGLVGLSHVLRQELVDAPGIDVCIVSPGAVDTPIYRRGANYIGRGMRPLPPALPPERVVRAILRAIDRPRREIIVGRIHRTSISAQRLAPGAYDRLVGPLVDHLALQRTSSPIDAGNVFEPSAVAGAIDDGWRRHDAGTALKAASVAAAVAAARSALSRRRRLGADPR